MIHLVLFELAKVWRRRAFIAFAAALLAVNLFILWYADLGGASSPGLSAYKRLHADLSGMSEEEKHHFVGELKDTIDGVSLVENVLLMRASDMGEMFAEQEIEEHPGIFEAYYDLYTSGRYLRYTSSLAAEKAFIDKIYGEERRVSGYGEYLQSVQENRAVFGGISIFAGQDENSFTSRNIEKSAADHVSLTADGIRWTPSAPITSAAQSVWTDLLMILLTFHFIGILVTDEKQNGLQGITRATRYGIVPTIAAKLAALLLHCLMTAAVFFTTGVLFAGASAGWWDVTARLQSVSAYLESSLDISILEFYALSAVTKGLTLFAAFAVITTLCIACGHVTAPYFWGSALWVVSWALYRFAPAASGASPVKHLNLFAFLRTENLFGAYLNLDIFGRPVSRTTLSLGLTAAVALIGAALCVLLYRLPTGQVMSRASRPPAFPFRPPASLARHEAYKLLITNRGLAVLLVFSCLIALQSLTNVYIPSSAERYYQTIMLRLEGELTEEKQSLIESEKGRFQEAFEKIDAIDAAVASGEIAEDTGVAMKLKWQAVTAFYPTFQRVLDQYELISEKGGSFLYDTGWLYLLGALGAAELTDFLLLALGGVLAFSDAGAMEYSSGAWSLINATRAGGRGIVRRKAAVCVLAAAAFSAVPFVFRLISVARAFPLHGLLAPVRTIPLYRALPAFLPTSALALAKLVLQIICGVFMGLSVLGLSFWRKDHIQTIFCALLILVVPCVLSALGFPFAERISLYSVYSCFFAYKQG